MQNSIFQQILQWFSVLIKHGTTITSEQGKVLIKMDRLVIIIVNVNTYTISQMLSDTFSLYSKIIDFKIIF